MKAILGVNRLLPVASASVQLRAMNNHSVQDSTQRDAEERRRDNETAVT